MKPLYYTLYVLKDATDLELDETIPHFTGLRRTIALVGTPPLSQKRQLGCLATSATGTTPDCGSCVQPQTTD